VAKGTEGGRHAGAHPPIYQEKTKLQARTAALATCARCWAVEPTTPTR